MKRINAILFFVVLGIFSCSKGSKSNDLRKESTITEIKQMIKDKGIANEQFTQISFKGEELVHNITQVGVSYSKDGKSQQAFYYMNGADDLQLDPTDQLAIYKPIGLDDFNWDMISTGIDKAVKLVQEEEPNFVLGSVGEYVMNCPTNNEGQKATFSLQFTDSKEKPDNNGRVVTTNYYEIEMIQDAEGNVSYK